MSARLAAMAVALAGPLNSVSLGQASPYRGLWVGSASLVAVNEVPVPLDANNVPIAPNPRVPTATFDNLDIRLILHVNGAGQAFLLKDVAILNRVHGANSPASLTLATENDLALVTDPRLYSVFPPQPAARYASAVFDFGDAKATEALDAIVDSAVLQATAYATNASLNVSTPAALLQARTAGVTAITPSLETIAENANVSEGFNQFLQQFTSLALAAIIADTSDPVVATLTASAVALRDASFYGDTRALDMINGVVEAIDDADPADRSQAGHFTASSYADVQNLHQRFISGRSFGDLISAAAQVAATASQVPGATAASIESEMRATPEATVALTESLQARVQMYDDFRSSQAIDTVLAAMAEAAFDNAELAGFEITLISEQVGRAALAEEVARYPIPVDAPTVDYNQFVTSPAFAGAPAKAAFAAVDAALRERADNVLFTVLSVSSAARIAAVNALQAEYAAAARAMRTELPLAGVFAPGSGDTRFVAALPAPTDLGAPGLTGRIYLPASHPTNPFRHRRHPDHTSGFNIERLIRLDFDDSPGGSLEAAGYGVDRISGMYREEVMGLHKPLGPDPVNNPIGLKTEGRFDLYRISLIDTLNTR
ncbi:MAG TPA: hypothetical protein PKE55_01955 [Kiritimatiellia bacterium]|nr:hypothetical protein [Kiritimatiellia bacterium]